MLFGGHGHPGEARFGRNVWLRYLLDLVTEHVAVCGCRLIELFIDAATVDLHQVFCTRCGRPVDLIEQAVTNEFTLTRWADAPEPPEEPSR